MWSSTLILEFGYVERAIGRPQQMGLRSTPKSAQVLDGRDARSHTYLPDMEFGEK
jgi:hypothetical protein